MIRPLPHCCDSATAGHGWPPTLVSRTFGALFQLPVRRRRRRGSRCGDQSEAAHSDRVTDGIRTADRRCGPAARGVALQPGAALKNSSGWGQQRWLYSGHRPAHAPRLHRFVQMLFTPARRADLPPPASTARHTGGRAARNRHTAQAHGVLPHQPPAPRAPSQRTRVSHRAADGPAPWIERPRRGYAGTQRLAEAVFLRREPHFAGRGIAQRSSSRHLIRHRREAMCVHLGTSSLQVYIRIS